MVLAGQLHLQLQVAPIHRIRLPGSCTYGISTHPAAKAPILRFSILLFPILRRVGVRCRKNAMKPNLLVIRLLATYRALLTPSAQETKPLAPGTIRHAVPVPRGDNHS
jgi:hypothetical protein